MLTDHERKAVNDFIRLEAEHGETIDPNQEHYFESIAIGFFIGRGFDLARVHEMARRVYSNWDPTDADERRATERSE